MKKTINPMVPKRSKNGNERKSAQIERVLIEGRTIERHSTINTERWKKECCLMLHFTCGCGMTIFRGAYKHIHTKEDGPYIAAPMYG